MFEIVFKLQTEDKATILCVQYSVSKVVLAAAAEMARNDPTTTNFRILVQNYKLDSSNTVTHQNLVSNARFAHFLIERVLQGFDFISE